MSKGNTFENDLLKLIFNATPIDYIADNAATTPLTDLYVSLHTTDPGEAGDQTTGECTYGGYARVSVARTSSGWTILNNSVSPNALIQFPAATSGTQTAAYAAIGTHSTGTGKVLYKGALTPTVAISTGVIPFLSQASAITED